MNKLVSRNPILRFKLGRKIIKARGGVWSKLFDLITDTDLAYMDNPAVMTAAGHTSRVSGVHAPTAEERQLGENLTEIGKAGAAAVGGEALLAVKGTLSTSRAVSTVRNTKNASDVRVVSDPDVSVVSLGQRALPGRVSTSNVPAVRSTTPAVRGNARPNTITVEGRTISSRTLPSRSSTLGRKVVGTTMAAYPAALLISSDSNSENGVALGANVGASVGANIASNMPNKNRVARRHDYGKGEVKYYLDKNTGIWYAKWNDPTKPNLGWYKVAEGSTGYDRFGNHNVLRNGKWVKIDKTPVISTPLYQFGKMGGWNSSMGSSIDQDSLNMLLEMGYNIDKIDARTIQNDINTAFGPNAVNPDNRWGNLSRAGLKALYKKWKDEQPLTTETKTTVTQPSITKTPEFLERLRQLFIKEETPEQLADRTIANNVDNLQFKRNGNYNRSGIRDLIGSYGLRAYDFTGALRKALRQYLNGESNDTSLLTNGLERFIVPYKQGGQLPSRNIVKRFKNRKFN